MVLILGIANGVWCIQKGPRLLKEHFAVPPPCCRYPVTATFPPALSINGILQARVPSLVSVKRPQFVLRVQMSLPESAQQAVQRATERPRPSGQQVGRKRKAPTPETEVRLAIQMAARENDVDAAFEAYTAAKSLSLKLPLDTYVTVLFLASGGDDWEAEVDRRHATKGSEAAGCGAPKFTKYLDQCQEILESMRAAGHTPNEMCHTAMARREALLGRPDRAFEHAMQVASPDNKSAPRLRCFAPALVGYAVAGKGAEAFSVFAAIDAAGLEPAEAEYRRLLQASALAEPGTGVLWPQIEDVLHRMARELTTLQPTTIEMVKQVFTSPIAAAGSKSSSAGEEQRWVVEACTVSESGDCAAVGERLEAVDLSESEYEEFKRGVAELAARQARQPGDFQTFVKWLETNGPYGAIIDAANVSFYGQNYDAGGFSFAQVG